MDTAQVANQSKQHGGTSGGVLQEAAPASSLSQGSGEEEKQRARYARSLLINAMTA